IKVMGLGYGQTADYVRDIHQLVETEPVMMLLRHGVAGFCLGYVPVLAAVVWIAVRVLRRLKEWLSDLNACSLLYSAIVAFAASVVVGHVLQSPSVSVLAVAVYGQLLGDKAGKELK
ncbi:MAG: O-antigen ligase family protein, partial [Clostridia bacterium]|nr:O-antigen ligase family protein [Clostridia bacterium]